MAYEPVGPGGVSNNYGVRETTPSDKYSSNTRYDEEWTPKDNTIVTAKTDPVTGGSRISSSVDRPATIVLFGDSRTADCNYDVSPNTYSTNMSWFEYGNSCATGGPVLDLVKNSGVGGNTTQQMLDRIDADVIAYRPGYSTIWGGTNDGWTSNAEVDASYDRMRQMIVKMVNAGIYVFVISETVCNSSKGTSFPWYVARYNDALRALCAGLLGCEFVDFNAQVVDPASAFGYAKSTMLRDGVHLSPYGASVVGKNVFAVALSRLNGRLSSLVCSQVDTQSNNTSSRNILGNPLMLGSVSASGSGQTGTWPTGWTTSGKASVGSTPARSDGVGNDFQVAITADSGGSFFANYAGVASRLMAGKQYVIEAEIDVSNVSQVTQVSLTVDLAQSGVTYRRGAGYAVQAPASGDSILPMTKILRSDVFTAPAGAYTGLSMLLRVLFAAAGTCTVKLGRVSLKQID